MLKNTVMYFLYKISTLIIPYLPPIPRIGGFLHVFLQNSVFYIVETVSKWYDKNWCSIGLKHQIY